MCRLADMSESMPITEAPLAYGLYVPLQGDTNQLEAAQAAIAAQVDIRPLPNFFGIVLSQREVLGPQDIINRAGVACADLISTRLCSIQAAAHTVAARYTLGSLCVIPHPSDPASPAHFLAYELQPAGGTTKQIAANTRHDRVTALRYIYSFAVPAQTREELKRIRPTRGLLLPVAELITGRIEGLPKSLGGAALKLGLVTLGPMKLFTETGQPAFTASA